MDWLGTESLVVGAATVHLCVLLLFVVAQILGCRVTFVVDSHYRVLEFVLISFVAGAHEGVFRSRTANPHIVVDGLGVLVSIPEGLAVVLLI